MTRARTPLTLSFLKRLEKDALLRSKEMLVPDGAQPSLYAAVRRSGQVTFQLRFRAGTGRGAPIRAVSIGRWGEISLDHARERAKIMLGQIADGMDPAAERDATRHSNKATFAEFGTKYFATRGLKLAATTRAEWKRLFDRELEPRFGKLPLASISYEAIAEMHQKCESRKRTGNQLLTVLSAILSEAVVTNNLPAGFVSPVHAVKRWDLPKRERAASRAEYRRLGLALDRARRGTDRYRARFELSIWSIAAIEFLALTGWREMEALTLRWDQIDAFTSNAKRLTTKIGVQNRVIGKSAVALLRDVPRIAKNPYVFCGAKVGTSLQATDRAWSRIVRDARISDFRLHDLRHSWMTEAVNNDQSADLANIIIGHVNKDRYAHPDRILIKVADDTSAHIARYLAGRRAEWGIPRALRVIPVRFDQGHGEEGEA